MSTDNFLDRIFCALQNKNENMNAKHFSKKKLTIDLHDMYLYPKTKSIESMTLLFPLPLGPTIDVKLLWKGPSTWLPAYDLKKSFSMWVIINLNRSNQNPNCQKFKIKIINFC